MHSSQTYSSPNLTCLTACKWLHIFCSLIVAVIWVQVNIATKNALPLVG
jgi:hypothetical protein